MREYIEVNLTVIRKYLKKRKMFASKLNNVSIMEEFKEWSKDPLPETESIWTLPDLTSCLLYTSPSPRDISGSRMPSSA